MESLFRFSVMTKSFLVTFEPSGKSVRVPFGSTILDAAHSIDVDLDHACGGSCACATCHVIVKTGANSLEPKTQEEDEMLQMAPNSAKNSRLACQTEVLTDLIVEIPSPL